MLYNDLVKAKMEALKEHNTAKRSVLEIVTGKAMLVKIDKRKNNEDLTDADVLKVIQKTIKELEEEIDAFEKANRLEKVTELKAQLDVLSIYLPKLMSEDEIRKEIESLEDKSIPSVMKHFKVNFAGKCDMKTVNKIANDFK